MQPDEGHIIRNLGISRIEPSMKSCSFADETGTLRKGVVVNLSQIDVLIKTSHVPCLTSRIIFSGSPRRVAEVTRTFEIGFVAKFCIPIPHGEFSAGIQFVNDETGHDDFVG